MEAVGSASATGQPIPVVVSRERAIQIARSAVGQGPASTGGERSQVVVDGLDGRVIAIAQVFS